ncbi:MAG TPA: hypothetical protein VGG94_00615 [Chthoniobacterales bacterium]
MPNPTSTVTQDAEHLRLLSIFHYVVGGLAALFAFFPLLYVVIGFVFVYAAHHHSAAHGNDVPPEVLGWIFIAMGSFIFLIGLAVTLCIILSGRALAQRKRYWFVFVVACLECLFVPFGTILGVFTLIVLSR